MPAFPEALRAAASSNLISLMRSSVCFRRFRCLHHAQVATPKIRIAATAKQKICHHDKGPIASPDLTLASAVEVDVPVEVAVRGVDRVTVVVEKLVG
jgi:hypothetical protein